MPYWRLFYHLVWTTKRREPLLTPDIELRVHGFLRHEAEKLNAKLVFVNGMADHVHVLVSVGPVTSPASLVKQLKGSSSRFVTTALQSSFQWQDGYGVLSVSDADVPRVIEYIKRQKEHHSNKTLRTEFEETNDREVAGE